MQDYETEEQRVEALKAWLKKNGSSVILGVALGMAGIFGWRYYLNNEHKKSEEASGLYYDVAGLANQKQGEAALETADKLKAEYKSSPYTSLAALLMAKFAYLNSKNDEAIKQLDWVIKNAQQPAMQDVARLRLARIQLANKKYDEAAKLLSVKHAPSFDAEFYEVKGDIYVAQNDIQKARDAYDKAIAAAGSNASESLKLKRQDLGNNSAAESNEPAA